MEFDISSSGLFPGHKKRVMFHPHCIVLVLLYVVLIAVFPFLANAKDKADLSASASRRTVRVGMFPLYGYHNYENGEPVGGYGYDYLQHLRCFAPWNYQYSSIDHGWGEMLPMLESGQIDMVSCVLKTPEREAKFAFSKHPAGEIGAILTVKAGDKKYTRGDYAHWNGIRVGLIRDNHWNDFFIEFAKTHQFTFTPVYYSTQEEMLVDLQAETKIDAAVSNEFRRIQNEWVYDRFGVSEFFIAVRKQDRALLAELDRAMDELIEAQPKFSDELLHQHYYTENGGQIMFSRDEIAFIRKMKESGTVFTAIMNPDRKPISYLHKGQYQGAMKDVANEIIRRTGLNIRFIPVQTLEEYHRKIQAGEVDLVFDLVREPAAAENTGYVLSSPYFSASTSLLHCKDNNDKFKSVAVIASSSRPVFVNDLFAPNPEVVEVKSLSEAVSAVKSGRLDAFYVHTRVAEYIANNDWREHFAVRIVPDAIKYYRIGILDSRNPLLASIINKAAVGIDNAFVNSVYLNHRTKTDIPILRKLIVHHPVGLAFVILAILALLTTALLVALKSRKKAQREREFLANIIRSGDDATIVADRSGRVLMMNPAAEEITGVSGGWANGCPIEKIFHRLKVADGTKIESFARTALAERRTVETKQRLCIEKDDGTSERHVVCKAMLVRESAKKEFGVILVIRDISGDLKREMEMQREIDNWNVLSKVAKVYRYELNYKTRELSGDITQDVWPTENGIALPPEDWIIPEDVEQWRKDYMDLVSGKKHRLIANHRINRNGKILYYREFMRIDPQNPEMITGVIQDVTNIIVLRQHQEAATLLWQTCIEAIPFIAYAKSGKDFRYLQCNAFFADFIGATPSEIIGKTDAELLYNPQDVERCRLQDAQTIAKGGAAQTFHDTRMDGKGRIHRVMTVKTPATDINGEPVVIGISVDETDEYLKNLELQELANVRHIVSCAFEQLFSANELNSGIEAILNKVCEFIGFTRAYVCCIDETDGAAKLYTSYVPPGEKSLLGGRKYSIEKASELPICKKLLAPSSELSFGFDLTRAEDVEQVEDHIPGLRKHIRKFDIQGLHINYVKVKNKLWGHVGFITQYAPQKELTENEKRLLDMTAHIIELAVSRRQTTAQLEQALHNAKAADKAKSFFLASMSHEIRTPLNAVIGFAELLNDRKLDEDTRSEYLNSISLAGNALLQLINDILDLSKLDAGQVELSLKKVDFTEFCKELAAVFQNGAEQKNLKLTFETDDIPALFIDQQRIRQILFNLIGNALKFTKHGWIAVRAKFEKTAQESGTLTLKIADSGIGISAEDAKRLFAPFVQLSQIHGMSARNNGTGLGLAIVQKMVSRMGGRVTLESKLNEGSTFMIVLPNVRCEGSGNGECESLTAMESGLCAPGQKPRLLLVDDTAINLKVLGALLHRLHVPFSTAVSGDEALEKLKTGDFNIVLTDLFMPGMNGEELVGEIRKNSTWKHVKIGVVTAESDRNAFAHELFDRILTKPVSRDDLYNAIYGR